MDSQPKKRTNITNGKMSKRSSQSRTQPWHHHLTLDLLVRVLARSVFHPAITLIFYLCLASVHQHTTPLAYGTLYYSAFLAFVEVLVWLNHRVVYGRRRIVKWAGAEVVVITGGASGLGRVLVEMLVRKGARVGVLDVRSPDGEMEELMEVGDMVWEVCDVADLKAVESAVETIRDELGSPTILINNAATAISGLPLLLTSSSISRLSPAKAAHTLHLNAISHFNTLSTILPFLKSAPNGGTVVTISSILSHLDPANLSDYVAAKSAVSSLHASLEHEIRVHQDPRIRQNLKTILVETGQMETPLFSNMTALPWYANFYGPVLDAKDVATEIVKVLDRGDGGVIRMPFYASLMPWYAVLPCSVQGLVRWFSGIDRAISVPGGESEDRVGISKEN